MDINTEKIRVDNEVNKYEEPVSSLLKEKKYEEAVDLILGKEGSENDISRTYKLGVMSAIGREHLLHLFESGLDYKSIIRGFDGEQQVGISGIPTQEILNNRVIDSKLGNFTINSLLLQDSFDGSEKINLQNLSTEESIAKTLLKLRQNSDNNNDNKLKP